MKPPEHQSSELTPANLCRLLELRLKTRLLQDTSSTSVTPHPNEDLINAFVEGALSEAELHSLVSHLVGCASCLHLTAELIRHEPVTDEINSRGAIEEQPGPFKRFIDSFAKGISTLNEDAVFAYEEKEEVQPSKDDMKSDADK